MNFFQLFSKLLCCFKFKPNHSVNAKAQLKTNYESEQTTIVAPLENQYRQNCDDLVESEKTNEKIQEEFSSSSDERSNRFFRDIIHNEKIRFKESKNPNVD
ncbi:hypothetical protein EDEG_02304 [Edhazardia aedis USNM 41457]|uniref:Uncharacterized protein n=1 Tax=Edhazardia aedis (strain USNM 41457) TaxID=1003232 RepID=J9DPR3_EDHAE|nr:hypothetical protein EDEG_02304 [Edhazardia aedis USNM 41457]|eukprot:EJW03347.1 hypothetical protein EDEG_02304 [Edhazardia aedis USNM 41457]